MNLTAWAIKWGIPADALYDLKNQMGVHVPPSAQQVIEDASEAANSVKTRLAASRAGARLWRNNVGATYTKDGAFVRYGLANESAQMNKLLKSADLIGIRPTLITSQHVGHTLGVFLSREIKRDTWTFSGTERDHAQAAWVNLILSLGGDAAIVRGEGDI